MWEGGGGAFLGLSSLYKISPMCESVGILINISTLLLQFEYNKNLIYTLHTYKYQC